VRFSGFTCRSALRSAHAAAERDASDTVLVVLEDEAGHRGFGEILARSYVTGESSEAIFTTGAPQLGAVWLGGSSRPRKPW